MSGRGWYVGAVEGGEGIKVLVVYVGNHAAWVSGGVRCAGLGFGGRCVCAGGERRV